MGPLRTLPSRTLAGITPAHSTRASHRGPTATRSVTTSDPVSRGRTTRTEGYKISQRSVGPNGQRLLSPEDVMKLINSAAELEQKFNMLFTLRRKDTRMPWSPGNIELLPSDEVDAERKAQIEAAAALQANAQGGVYDD